jgi:ABC-type transport system involved in multi-copper enzyme maturation permease subunit
MFIGWVSIFFLVVFTALVILGIIAKVYAVKSNLEKLLRRAVQRAGSLLLTMGLVGLLIYFFTFENVPILSMRVWLLVLLASGIAWAWSIYRYVKVEIPAKREMHAERERLNKWLPKAKK